MSDILYYALSALLSALVLLGLAMQSRVKSAVRGNLICVGVMGLAILLTLYKDAALGNPLLWLAMAVGAAVGLLMKAAAAVSVKFFFMGCCLRVRGYFQYSDIAAS